MPGAVPAIKERRTKRDAAAPAPATKPANMVATKQRSNDPPAVVPGAVPAMREHRSKQQGGTRAAPALLIPTTAIDHHLEEEDEDSEVEADMDIEEQAGGARLGSSAPILVASAAATTEPSAYTGVTTAEYHSGGGDIMNTPKYNPMGAPKAVGGGTWNDNENEEHDNKKDPHKGGMDVEDQYDVPDDELAVAVEVDSDEDIEVVNAEQIDPMEQKKKMRKRMKIAGGIGAIVVAVVVVVAVFVTQESVDAPVEVPATAVPTPSPTSSRRADIEGLLLENGVVLSSDDVQTAQYKAFEWISDEDEQMLSSTDVNLLQRYALSVFHYATGEGMSQCQEQYKKYVPKACGADKYPFLNSSHECDWYGTTCTEDDVVTSFQVGKFSFSYVITRVNASFLYFL